MQLLRPSNRWYVAMLLLIEASETACIICNSVHSLQRTLSWCAAWHCKCIVVHLHLDIATVSQHLSRHLSSNIVCDKVNMHSAATYESQVQHHHWAFKHCLWCRSSSRMQMVDMTVLCSALQWNSSISTQQTGTATLRYKATICQQQINTPGIIITAYNSKAQSYLCMLTGSLMWYVSHCSSLSKD